MKLVLHLFTIKMLIFTSLCVAYTGNPYTDFQSVSVGHIQVFLDSYDGNLKNKELYTQYSLDSANYSAKTGSTWVNDEFKPYPKKNGSNIGDSGVITMSPAEMIYFASTENKINPVLLLTKLQDEFSLIKLTLDEISKKYEKNPQYILNRATGYGIYTGKEVYKSFLAQLVGCTYQFRNFLDNDKSIKEAYEDLYTQTNTFAHFDKEFYSPYAKKMTQIIKDEPLCKPFSDVLEREKECTALQYLHKEGIIEGHPDGTFKPYNLINRAEFVKVVLRNKAEGYFCSETFIPFSDIPFDAWYCALVSKAKNTGLTSGYPNGEFRPTQPINRAETTKILYIDKYDEEFENTDQWWTPYNKHRMSTCNERVFGKNLPYPAVYMRRGQMVRLMYCMLGHDE